MGLMLLRRDAVELALVRSATPGVNATAAVYIGITGVDDLHEQCAARGARIVTGLTDHPWGLRDFVVEMPGGHRLALGERIGQPRLGRWRADRLCASMRKWLQNLGYAHNGRGSPDRYSDQAA